MKTIQEQVGGRPLSAVTPEKTMDAPSGQATVDDEGAQQLREAGGAAMPPDLTMKCIVEAWNVLPAETRSELQRLLIESETSSGVPGGDTAGGSLKEDEESFQPLNGHDHAKPEPLARAPKNVFVFRGKQQQVLGWRNVFDLPIQYDVELCPGLLSRESATLSNRFRPEDGPRRRFVVIDEAVSEVYGAKMSANFDNHGVEVRYVVLPGEEANKRMEAVDTILEELCRFGLRRREPILAVGGGVLLDIVGMAASLYRRGVPFVRVPTTLLALVDASVGVKNGVDYCSCSMGPQKNRVGTFYAPVGAFLDKSFIATQDERNIINGLGEIMKLALVRSTELFSLLELHGARLVRERFQGADGVSDRVIELSVQIMLEELGPNLWEHKLERCVDYGHTFSKIIEMEPAADIMHGEAVNVDGFLCLVIAKRRGMITEAVLDRVFRVMKSIGLPTIHESVQLAPMVKGLADAVEHRHGKQRVPLLKGCIGSSVCVNDINPDELKGAIAEAWALHGDNEDAKP
ncbi:unnamed protein product [Ectocarpus sp. 6 AP-2014]